MSRSAVTDLMRTLAETARVAQRAPSVFNTQPWTWRVGTHTLDLLRDPARQLLVTDADARQLTISCGAALHHARVALAAAGRRVTVTRFPDPAQPDLLARLEVHGRADADPHVRRLRGAIASRRTDRRGFSATPVPAAALSHFRAAAEAEGCALHVVGRQQIPMLEEASVLAAAQELADPAYRAELREWTDRPAGNGDGVPTATAAENTRRPVRVRDFAPDTHAGRALGEGDSGATYAILYGADDNPQAWLRAGEALSAVLLTAVLDKIGVSPMSDVLEVNAPRQLVHGLLPGGHPYLVLRFGVPVPPDAPPPAPHRRADKVVRFD